MSPAECEAAAAKLSLLPELKRVKLGGEGGMQDWESLRRLRALLPDTAFKYSFTLYGKTCDLSDSSLNFSHIPIEDNGAALRQVIPLMSELNYVDMDTTGLSNQEMEKLRADFPDVKFVWRVWFGESYSVRTDVQRILASKPTAGGMLYPWDVEALSCCHDVVFLDLGHNKQLTDISFVAQMPKLEVAILGMCDWSDATPLASCPELEYLEMFSTNCTDLKPLAGLSKLEHLNIAGNVELEDISPLYGMTQLKRLYLGSMNRVPWEQCEEFQKRVPNCEFDTQVYDDPTGGHWRWDSDGNQVDRYYLLRMQFGYYEDDVYSFTWNDKLY
jgi:Leucine-rich repeat (LRR) protein